MKLTAKKRKHEVRNIVVLAHPYSTLFNISSPIEVFQMAIDQMIETNMPVDFSYNVHVVSAVQNKIIDVKPKISINCECSYYEVNYPIDTLIVIGSPRNIGYKRDVLDWLQKQSKNVRRICSMCAGAFTLAEAGILNNKKAVTHWQLCNEMATQYPSVDVSQDAIFVKHNNVYTSAGVSAGLDLSLALIEEDLGKAFALRIAKLMVLFLKRPGNQTQYSIILESQKTDYEPIKRATEWIQNHLDEDVTVEKLAEISAMSSRNFARIFVKELNITPIKYIEKLRIETACRYLTDTNLSIDQISTLTGFKTPLNMNRAFQKKYQTSPSQYRSNFSSVLTSPNLYY